MKALQRLESEVAGQPGALASYAKARLPSAPAGSIFAGAGDSYAAALLGFYASRGRCIALDPYTLASEPEAARGVEVFFISVSGRTSSNALALSRVKRVAKKTTLLTADDGSPLARGADEIVRLPMSYAPRSPGILSFSLSALAVLKVVGAAAPCDFPATLERAKADSKSPSLATGTTYFLGNSLAHAAALYAAAKVYEILGRRAQAEALEEFSHMELFSLGRSDAVNIFSAFDPDRMSGKLKRALAAEGFASAAVPARGMSATEHFFHCVFVSQLWCLAEARRAGIAAPRFLTEARRLRVSDRMIY
ncbi:MAG: hypothetical protein JRN28_01060 [Nitrososphaerota archaeon]|nr:hypothetical protein [Nitrososphaerota archaeon]